MMNALKLIDVLLTLCLPSTELFQNYSSCSCLIALGKLRGCAGVLINCESKQSPQQTKLVSEMTLYSAGSGGILVENRIWSPESKEKPYLQKYLFSI